MSDLVQRDLLFEFDLGNNASGTFASGVNSQSISGYRASVNLSKAGGLSMVTANVKILGLTQDVMGALTKLGVPLVDISGANMITISAGTKTGLYAQIFQGPIFQAWADFQSAPDVPFLIKSNEGLVDALTPAPPTSVKGGADVATIMRGLAAQMNGGAGYTFQNSGVSVQISNPYLPGTLRQQAYALAQAANINIIIENGTLAIWSKGQARDVATIAVSGETGMIGFPTFTDQGIVVRTLFNPDVLYGGQIDVTSVVPGASGTWNIYQVEHHLESETLDGKWETQIWGSLLGQAPQTTGG